MDAPHITSIWDKPTVECVTDALGAKVHELCKLILDLDPVEERADVSAAVGEMRTCLAAIRDFGG